MGKLGKILIFILMTILVIAIFVFSVLNQNSTNFVVNTSSNNNSIEYSLTNLNNSLTTENITFTSTESYLRYLTIPKNSVVKSAKMNVSGLVRNISTPYIWVANSADDDVSMLNASNGYARKDFAVGDSPYGVAIDSNNNVWVVNNIDRDVSMLNASNGYARKDFAVGIGAYGVAIDSNNNVWVANYNEADVSMLNSSNGYARTDFAVGSGSYGIAIDSNNNVWVANSADDDVSMLNYSNGYARTDFAVGNFPYSVAIDSNNNVWIVNNFDDNLSMLNASNGYYKKNYSVGNEPKGIVIDSNNNVWVANSADNDVSMLNASNGYARKDFAVGNNPQGVAIDFNNNVWIVNWNDDDVSMLNASNGYARKDFAVGNMPLSLGDFTGFALQKFVLKYDTTFPSNSTINIGNDNDVEFNNTGIFNTTNQTNDFSGEINDYTSTCSQDTNGNCNVPINITSTDGEILLNAINTTYDYNVSNLFTRNDTYTWNDTTEIQVNTPQKRRFKIQPTSNLASNNISLGGYYLNFSSSNSCEINNTPYTPTSGYCPFNFNITQGNYWLNHYIYDINITPEVIAVNITNTTKLDSDILYQNFTLFYKDADNISQAQSGLFQNTTLSWNYNNSVSEQEKISIYLNEIKYDITPSILDNCPNYEKKTIDSKVLYTCLNRTNKYASVKIESN